MAEKSGAAPAALTIEDREWAVLTFVGELRTAVRGFRASLDERILAWEREALEELQRARDADSERG